MKVFMESRFEMFTVLIAKASRCIYKIKTGEMSEYNLKSSHVSCLYYLYKADSLTAKELCDLCGEDKANISRAIKHLESEGYIYCQSTAAKRYQSALILTDKGKTVGKDIT
ncbi:MAG: MarR family transcriptional regulator, partial [Clostridia bacterium]|nr:MarR family transcriptional regulator [Clostridia bacterium]